MAVKNDRIRVYLLGDAGSKGKAAPVYRLSASDENDSGYWAGLSPSSIRARVVGAQLEHVVTYDVTMDDHVPVHNTSDAILTLMPDETLRMHVQGLMLLRSTGEKQARVIDVSDADYTLTD
jgi:hypothetical protein